MMKSGKCTICKEPSIKRKRTMKGMHALRKKGNNPHKGSCREKESKNWNPSMFSSDMMSYAN